MIRCLAVVLYICLFIHYGDAAAHAEADPLSTTAEKSGFKKAGRYDEVIRLCAVYQKAYPKAVRCTEFGRTPEGRPMLA